MQQSVGGFGALLNWRKDEQCTVTLCADAADPAACQAASTDSLRELNTDCVGVADGFMGYNHSSYPLSYLAVWPTSWNTTGSGDVDRLAFPEVRTDSGFDDSFSLWFRNTDQVAAPRCYPTSDFTLPASAPCQDTRKLLLNQTIPPGSEPFDANNPATYRVSLQYETRNINQVTPLRVRLFVHETGAGTPSLSASASASSLNTFSGLPSLLDFVLSWFTSVAYCTSLTGCPSLAGRIIQQPVASRPSTTITRSRYRPLRCRRPILRLSCHRPIPRLSRHRPIPCLSHRR